MTEESTSEQEAAVRRLLAEARHDEPVPAHVVARLDAVLDELVADEGVDDLEVFESGGSGSVTELACVRRRRRNAGRLLLAAAAVVVGGVAVGQSLGDTGLDVGSDSDAGDSALAEAPRESADRAQGGGDGDDTAEDGIEEQASGSVTSGEANLLDAFDAPVVLTSDNFAADVQRELGQTAAERRKAANGDYDAISAYTSTGHEFVCAAGPYGKGATLPAYYDAEEAVLVLRPPSADVQRVDLLACGTAVRLNSVELPAR